MCELLCPTGCCAIFLDDSKKEDAIAGVSTYNEPAIFLVLILQWVRSQFFARISLLQNVDAMQWAALCVLIFNKGFCYDALTK
jgi:hypothetical protein